MKIIAEIGWNHMGNINLAKEMIDAAKESGADFAKFQTWSVKNLKPGPWDSDGRREIYEKAELTKEMHQTLYDHCNKNGIKFLTSIFNIKDLEKINNLNLDTIKIPSHEIYNKDLISKISNLFKNVLVSTGASLWAEILDLTKIPNFNKIFLLHCVSSYPCEFKDLQFNKFYELKKISKNKIGYSGHYPGIEDAKIAINLNASYNEKHFTIDNNLPGRDNKFAILPYELRELSSFINSIYLMKKDKGKNLQKFELDTYKNYRGRWKKN